MFEIIITDILLFAYGAMVLTYDRTMVPVIVQNF
jgi:hypothetical protein